MRIKPCDSLLLVIDLQGRLLPAIDDGRTVLENATWMVDVAQAPSSGLTPAAGLDGGTQIGKRYVDAADTVEILVTKSGAGSLSLGGTPLDIKSAKPLPSSD